MLNFITDQVWKGGAILAVLLAVAGGLTSLFMSHELNQERGKTAKLSNQIHEMNAGIAERERDAMEMEARAQTQMDEARQLVVARQSEIGDAKFAENQRNMADARSAVVASTRMLQRAQAEHQALTDNDRRAAGSKSASVSPAAGQAGNLFTDLLGRMDTDARLIAAFADEASTRGSECEGRYDALRVQAVDTSASGGAH